MKALKYLSFGLFGAFVVLCITALLCLPGCAPIDPNTEKVPFVEHYVERNIAAFSKGPAYCVFIKNSMSSGPGALSCVPNPEYYGMTPPEQPTLAYR